jgi:hypothetical protein
VIVTAAILKQMDADRFENFIKFRAIVHAIAERLCELGQFEMQQADVCLAAIYAFDPCFSPR